MRRKIASVLVLIMAILMVACGKSDGESEKTISLGGLGKDKDENVVAEVPPITQSEPENVPLWEGLDQDITGVYVYSDDGPITDMDTDIYKGRHIEISNVSGTDVYFAIWREEFPYYESNVSEVYVAYEKGTLTQCGEDDRRWVVSFEGHDNWGAPIEGRLTIDRQDRVCTFHVEYTEEYYAEDSMGSLDGFYKVGAKPEYTTAKYESAMALQQEKYDAVQEQRASELEYRKTHPFVEDFGNTQYATKNTISQTVTYIEGYTDYVWYYAIYEDKNGTVYYAYTSDDPDMFLTRGAKYDITGYLYPDNKNLVQLTDIAVHPDKPALSNRFNRDYDSYFYDENTGLYVVSNTTMNHCPLKMTGIDFLEWQNGWLTLILGFENTSNVEYQATMFTVTLCTENGDKIANYYCYGFGGQGYTIGRPQNDNWADRKNDAYSAFLDSGGRWRDDDNVGKIPANSTFQAMTEQGEVGNEMCISYSTRDAKKKIYAIYVDVYGYK